MSAAMPEFLRPFARGHVLGVVLIGCLVLAVLTAERLWMWLGVIGGAAGVLWAALLLYGDRGRPPGA
jgi:hypothetical protein